MPYTTEFIDLATGAPRDKLESTGAIFSVLDSEGHWLRGAALDWGVNERGEPLTFAESNNVGWSIEIPFED